MKTVSQTITKVIPKLQIWQDEDAESPREWNDNTKLCIRKHHQYNFPNELAYDFDYEGEEGEEDTRLKDYFVFPLDCYIHGWLSFSLAWQGTQCRFDTYNNVGFIVYPRIATESITEEQAREVCMQEIEEYNKYMNWEVYWFTLYWEDWEVEDSCGWFYDIEDIKENLPDEWKDEKLYDYYK